MYSFFLVLSLLVHYFVWRETWTSRKVDQKYLKAFEMWWWRKMDKISCTGRVKNKQVSRRVIFLRFGRHATTGTPNIVYWYGALTINRNIQMYKI
jgi:hypothetical protein